ncbi:MAG TPA: divalent-cation tolerance protein CutA [Burkholderiaceae bacterium]|nr:divalent-cation tolerance protein CutA [Burkholderiaceae bacterium]
MSEPLMILTNCPDEATAERIARALVEQRLAACVNRLAPAHSIYRWEGAIEQAIEIPLLIKSTRERYSELEAAIRALHPYSVPEIIALPITRGYAPYLRWIDAETQPPLLA